MTLVCSISRIALIIACAFPMIGNAQTAAPRTGTSWPAPRRDITGIWEAFPRGIQGNGAASIPADGKPGHEPPYTPLGLEVFKTHHPAQGPTQVAAINDNDPDHICDPQGFPRENLYELRTTEMIQTPLQVVMLYTYGRIYRVIWTDGRELPNDPDPHWYGYSVGKWEDDTTFVVQSNGMDKRTWLDNAGRPHTEDLKVEERYHRVDRDTMELTTTIIDPKYYTKPWNAQDKFILKLRPPTDDIPEMMCAPSETSDYNQRHASVGAK